MKTLSAAFLLVISLSLKAQNNVQYVLGQIEKNNKTLQTLSMRLDAEKVGNKVGMNPSNPSVEYIYEWGKEESMGNRSEFNVSQTFDFPTAYIYRSKMVDLMNNRAEYEYIRAYNMVMLSAVQLCYQIVYKNMLEVEYEKRLRHAEGIDEAFSLKLETGDVNIIERNKAKLNLLNARNDLSVLRADLINLEQRLEGLNGGDSIQFDALLMPNATLPIDFEQWFAEKVEVMPQMQSMQEGLMVNQKKEQLNRALSYPQIMGGYRSEKGLTDEFKGLSVGLTIPLWENKNTVKSVKLQSLAMENQLVDERIRAYNGLKGLYDKASQLKFSLEDYKITLETMNSEELLKIALDSGEISILDYIVEQAIYYQAIENYAAVQMEYNITLAQLNYFDYE